MNYDAGGVVVVPLDWAPHTRFAEAKLSLKDTGLMCLGERGRPKLTVYRLIISTYETRGCGCARAQVSRFPLFLVDFLRIALVQLHPSGRQLQTFMC